VITLLDRAALLVLYCTPAPIMDYAEAGVARSLLRLRDHELISYREGELHDPNSYSITERGKVLCEALRDVPLPVSRWVIPVTVGDVGG